MLTRKQKLEEIIKLFELYGLKQDEYQRFLDSPTRLKELRKIVTPPYVKKEKILINDMSGLLGKRFTKLVPIKMIRKMVGNQPKTFYLCKCDCGNEKMVRFCHLKSGFVKGCGCGRKENIKKVNEERLNAIEIRKKRESDLREYFKRNKIG